MFEASQSSMAFPARGPAVLPRFVTRAYLCSSLCASASEYGDLPASELWDTSSATVNFPAPNSLWAEEDNPTLSERSDSASQADAPAFQQGESTEVMTSWLEGRRAFCPPAISSMALQEESVPPSPRCEGQALCAASPTGTQHLQLAPQPAQQHCRL